MAKLKLQNISGRAINVLCKRRESGEVFDVELPKTNKWTSETYLLSKVNEVNNLVWHKYIKVVEIEKNTEKSDEKRSDYENQQSMLGEYGLLSPL